MLFTILVTAGCINQQAIPKEHVEYDKEKVVNSLSKLTFNPEIPNHLPFEPAEIKVDFMDNEKDSKKNLITISFVNDNQEKVTYRAGKAENAIDFSDEEVNIHENLVGRYGEEENNKILTWNKNNIYYELFTDSNSISKKEVFDIARDFKQVN